MSHPENKLSRRSLLRGALGSVAVVSLASVTTRSAWGAEALSEDDPMAKALAYYVDGSSVDAAEHPNYKPEQNCANCVQYQGAAGEDVGGCAIFPNKTVAAKGWCKVWVKKP